MDDARGTFNPVDGQSIQKQNSANGSLGENTSATTARHGVKLAQTNKQRRRKRWLSKIAVCFKSNRRREASSSWLCDQHKQCVIMHYQTLHGSLLASLLANMVLRTSSMGSVPSICGVPTYFVIQTRCTVYFVMITNA